jgi:hypothetical protein
MGALVRLEGYLLVKVVVKKEIMLEKSRVFGGFHSITLPHGTVL